MFELQVRVDVSINSDAWHGLNVGYFAWNIINLNENEYFVVGLRNVTVLYFCHDNDGYLSEQQ